MLIFWALGGTRGSRCRFRDASQNVDWFSVPSDDKRPVQLKQPNDSTPPVSCLAKANPLLHVTTLPNKSAWRPCVARYSAMLLPCACGSSRLEIASPAVILRRGCPTHMPRSRPLGRERAKAL